MTKVRIPPEWAYTRADMGRRLLRLRVALGKRRADKSEAYTQTEFAARADLSQGAYGNYEIGARQPAIAALAKLRAAHDITLDWLLLGDPNNLTYGLIKDLEAVTPAEMQAARKKKR